jgi:hypothetical protein
MAGGIEENYEMPLAKIAGPQIFSRCASHLNITFGLRTLIKFTKLFNYSIIIVWNIRNKENNCSSIFTVVHLISSCKTTEIFLVVYNDM